MRLSWRKNQSSLCWARWAVNRPAARPGLRVRPARKGRKGRPGPQGPPGQNFDPADVARIAALETTVAELQAAIEELRRRA